MRISIAIGLIGLFLAVSPTMAQSLPADDGRIAALGTNDPDVQTKALHELVAVGAPAVPALVRLLGQNVENPATRKMAYETLFRMVQVCAGTDDAAHVERALVRELRADHSVETKRHICALLGFIAEENASVDALYIAINNPELAEAARQSLARIPNRRAGQCLMGAVQITTGQTRLGVIASLALRGDPAAASYIAGGAIEGDPATARAVMDALAVLPSPQSFDVLAQSLKSGKPGAASALIRLMETLMDAEMFQPAEYVLKTLPAASSLSVPERCRLLHACGRLATKKAVSIVFAGFKDDNARVRAAAVHACELLPGSDLTTAVAEQMAQATGPLKTGLIESLGRRGRWMNDAAAGKIIDALDDADESVRLAAIRAIRDAGITAGVRGLIKLLSDARGPVRDAAENALSHMPGQASAEAIAKMLDEVTPDIRAKLQAALARRGNSSFVPTTSRTTNENK
ncbi:MAG: HEAT repeat domain-containing protein [Phycisphaerae bacterium]